jgi:hypothetical protein
LRGRFGGLSAMVASESPILQGCRLFILYPIRDSLQAPEKCEKLAETLDECIQYFIHE